MPTTLGDCLNTSVAATAPRSANDPAAGYVVTFASGGQQVSSGLSGLNAGAVGDQVIVCLVTVPESCPANDHRGTIYSGADLTTGFAWREPDSDKLCGTN